MRTLWIGLGVLAATLAGCDEPHEYEYDGPEKPQLTWVNVPGTESLDLVAAHLGLMAGGARAEINAFAAHGHQTTMVTSSDPSIVRVEAGSQSWDMTLVSGRPGDVILSLHDETGAVLQVPMAVRPVAHLAPRSGWGSDMPVLKILLGAAQPLSVLATDADGGALNGDGAIQFTAGGEARFVSAPSGRYNRRSFDGNGVGDGTITASAGDQTLVLPITFVDVSIVTSLRETHYALGDDRVGVEVTPMAGTTPVFGGQCTWRLSDPSVQLWDDLAGTLDGGGAAWALIHMDQAGTFQATCAIGTQHFTIDLQRVHPPSN